MVARRSLDRDPHSGRWVRFRWSGHGAPRTVRYRAGARQYLRGGPFRGVQPGWPVPGGPRGGQTRGAPHGLFLTRYAAVHLPHALPPDRPYAIAAKLCCRRANGRPVDLHDPGALQRALLSERVRERMDFGVRLRDPDQYVYSSFDQAVASLRVPFIAGRMRVLGAQRDAGTRATWKYQTVDLWLTNTLTRELHVVTLDDTWAETDPRFSLDGYWLAYAAAPPIPEASNRSSASPV